MKEDFEKELQELSPFLADLKKQQKNEPFKTPRLYFDTLADKVIEKTTEDTKVLTAPPQYKTSPSLSEQINGWLSTILKPRLALSVLGLVVLVAVGWYAVRSQKMDNPMAAPQELVNTSDPKNEVKIVESPIVQNTSEEKINTPPNAVNTNSKTVDEKKADVAVNENLQLPIQNIIETKKDGFIHPESGLTEEEIEEFLKDALDDEDLETIGGKRL